MGCAAGAVGVAAAGTAAEDHLRPFVDTWLPRDLQPDHEVELPAEFVEVARRSPVRLCLVLDGADHLRRPETLRLAALLRVPRSGLRLVLAARCDPALPIARLRVEGRLCELRAPELRFTAEEADRLLQTAGLRLDRTQVELLHVRTDGWVAGLRLAAQRLLEQGMLEQGGPERFLTGFPGEEPVVSDYVAAEVLADLPDDEQELLRRISVCESVPAALAVELSGREDAAEVLDRLEHRTGLLVGQGAPRRHYRIQQMLRSCLSADVRRRGPDLTAALHERAAQWWAEQGQPVEALRHARATGHTGLLTDLLDRWAVLLVARGEHTLLQHPHPAVGANDPWLLLSAALVHLGQGRVSAAAEALRRARAGPLPVGKDLAEYQDAVEGLCGVTRGRPRGRATLPDDPALAALVLAARGAAALATGRPARDDLETARLMARAHDLAFLDAQCLCLLAVAGWAEGDLERAAEEAAAGLDAAATHGWRASPWTGWAAAAAAHVDLLRARPLQALALCTDALAVGPEQPALRATLRGLHGAAMFDTGDRVPGLAELHHARVELSGFEAPAAVCATVALLEQQAALELGHTTAAAGALGWLANRGVAPPNSPSVTHAPRLPPAITTSRGGSSRASWTGASAGRSCPPRWSRPGCWRRPGPAPPTTDRRPAGHYGRPSRSPRRGTPCARSSSSTTASANCSSTCSGAWTTQRASRRAPRRPHRPLGHGDARHARERRPHQALLTGQPRRDRRGDGGVGEHGQDASACHLRQAGCQRPPCGSTGGARAGTARMTRTC